MGCGSSKQKKHSNSDQDSIPQALNRDSPLRQKVRVPDCVDVKKYKRTFERFSINMEMLGDTSRLPNQTRLLLKKLFSAQVEIDRSLDNFKTITEEKDQKLFIFKMFSKFNIAINNLITSLLHDKAFNESFPIMRESFKEIFHIFNGFSIEIQEEQKGARGSRLSLKKAFDDPQNQQQQNQNENQARNTNLSLKKNISTKSIQQTQNRASRDQLYMVNDQQENKLQSDKKLKASLSNKEFQSFNSEQQLRREYHARSTKKIKSQVNESQSPVKSASNQNNNSQLCSASKISNTVLETSNNNNQKRNSQKEASSLHKGTRSTQAMSPIQFSSPLQNEQKAS